MSAGNPSSITPRDQLIADVLTTAVESGYPWFLYHEIERDDDCNVVRALVQHIDPDLPDDDPEQDATLREITPQWFRTAIRTYANRKFGGIDPLRRLALDLIVGDPDDVNFDVNDADSLLQLAVLGEVVYA